jgi:SMC interacting uncharacterized protein involved in chromosome segregation
MSRRTLANLSDSDVNVRQSISGGISQPNGILKKSQEFSQPRQSILPSKLSKNSQPHNSSRISNANNMSMNTSNLNISSNNVNSSLNNSRRISVMPPQTPSAGLKKETRNMADKDYQRILIKQIIEFLHTNNYPSELSVQSLILPGNKEVAQMLRFLIALIDPHYDIQVFFPLQKKDEMARLQKIAHQPEAKKQLDKLSKAKVDQKGYDEELLLALFAYLRYPCTLDKKRLTLNPHNWGYLLSGISWFVDLLRYSSHKAQWDVIETRKLVSLQVEDTEFDQNYGSAMLFEFTKMAYLEWMQDGQRGFENVVTRWARDFDKRNEDTYTTIQEMEDTSNARKKQIENFLLQERLHKTLENEKRNLEKSLIDKDQELQSAESTKRKLEHERNVFDQDLRNTRNELGKATRERDLLKRQIDAQEIRPEDVMRINQEKNQLEELLRQLSADLDILSEELYVSENALRDDVDRLQTKTAKEYNRLAATLYDTRDDEDDMRDDDDEEHPKHMKSALELFVTPGNILVGTTMTTSIDLRDACGRITQTTQESGIQCTIAENQLHEIDEQLDGGTEEMEILQDDIAELEKRLKKLENQHNTEKQVCKNELQQQAIEIEQEEQEIANLLAQGKKLQGDLVDSEKMHDQLVNDLAVLRKQQEQEKNIMNDHVVKILDRLTQHKSSLLQIIVGVEEKAKDTLEHIKQMD